jgi:hypothetical protein
MATVAMESTKKHEQFKVLEVAAIANRNGNHMVQHVLLPVNIHFH